jgi:hypothetical protein
VGFNAMNTVDVIHRHSRQATERSSVGDVVGENHEWPNLGSKSKTLGGECFRQRRRKVAWARHDQCAGPVTRSPPWSILDPSPVFFDAQVLSELVLSWDRS